MNSWTEKFDLNGNVFKNLMKRSNELITNAKDSFKKANVFTKISALLEKL